MGGAGVVCAGGAVGDLTYALHAPAVPGTSNPAAARTGFGGVARNVAENLAVLGVPVALVSCIGDDAAGAALRAALEGSGVGVGHVRVVPGATTAQYVAVIDPTGDLVLGIAAMDVLDDVAVADLDAAWPTGGWVFADTNLSADVLRHALARARGSEVRLAVDAVSTPKVVRLPADLTGLALLSLNADEARAYLGEEMRDEVALADAVRARGADVVLLTRGARGLVVAGADGVTELAAVPAVPLDVTGAGDALVAGTLAALIGGASPVQAAEAGARRAARTVESPLSVVPPEPS